LGGSTLKERLGRFHLGDEEGDSRNDPAR
jgi:hypothetical protein